MYHSNPQLLFQFNPQNQQILKLDRKQTITKICRRKTHGKSERLREKRKRIDVGVDLPRTQAQYSLFNTLRYYL